ncbi:E3 ubiquitin-protein ligase SPL2-like [Musa acuminata AAA Group]|uniref:RING-type E3 ubiquitin transferase n=1 Tax=Musa acuminata subsp. malaccensis TaxID=214687 RepID=A0A804J527_MUSAM|nr:PREDICTED: E3 ubiquitin-protein ligase SPL2 isoform X1 [Musa acuminata subsp. malaccensis]XP_009387101.1 PREDICTED: E3 ubiquitin-protein ligase SPL2 isoform X1 [Musa acuminata subsp. malaccensis]CAG1838817.1 unnamed protein product [Musa acuminata subsp. malaccensis]
MSFRDHEMAAAVGRLVLAYDGAIAGLALAAFAAVSWVKYLAASAALVRIRRATSVPISGLRSLLSSDDSSDEDGVLVVVRGLVQPSSTVEALGVWPLSKFRDVLTPRGSGERAVAVLSTQTCLYNEWRGMFGWSSDLNALLMRSWKERRSSSLELVPFILADGAKSSNSGYIHVNLDGSAHPLPLTTVYHELHPVQLTPCTFFQAIFGSGYPVALLHEEKILPVGKEITAIGICRPRDGALEIKSCKNLPFFLSDMTKDELEAELNSNTRILLWSGILIGTLSFGILGYALVRNWRKWKEWRTRRREIQDLHDESLIESSMEAEDAPEGELCVICLSTRRRSAFIPCGHLVCCSRCALHVERDSSPKCPVCRQDVRSSIRIYDS